MNIELRNVTKQFGMRPALVALSTRLKRSEIVVIGGPNGAGKSVLLKVLAGSESPTTGSVLWDGRSIEASLLDYKFRLGYMPQNPMFYEDQSLVQCLRYFGQLKMIPGHLLHARITDILRLTRLEPQARRTVKHLSGGQRSRLALGIALLNDPDLLLLDEPGAHLDPEERLDLWELIAGLHQGRIIVVTSHIFAGLGDIAQRLIILDEGMVRWDGSADTLLAAAAPHVWEMSLPQGTQLAWAGAGAGMALVVRQRSAGAFTEWRIIAHGRPSADAVPALPTLEDAYLWVRWRARQSGSQVAMIDKT